MCILVIYKNEGIKYILVHYRENSTAKKPFSKCNQAMTNFHWTLTFY